MIGPRLILSWSPLAFLEKIENAANANLSVGCNHFSIDILNTTVYLYIERNAAGNWGNTGMCRWTGYGFWPFCPKHGM